MAELVGDQATTAQAAEPVQQETQATAPATATPDPVAALNEKLAALEGQLGKQAEEVGQLRNTAEYWRQQASQPQAYQPQPWEMQSPYNPYGYQGQQKPVTDEAFLTEPVQTVQRMMDAGLSRIEANRQRDAQIQRQQEAYTSVTEGFGLAQRLNPELFKGVEQDTQRAMSQLVAYGYVLPSSARNPENWEKAARFIHMEKGNYDRIAPKRTTPPEPISGQSPNKVVKGYEPEADLSEVPATGMDIARKFGLDEKEIKEAVNESRRGR